MRKYLLTIALCGVLVLSGCTFGATVEDELSKVLAEMHDAEKPYRDGQNELNEIEETEQNLFNETMELTQEDSEKLKANIAEMEELLKERLIHIENEEDAMKKAKGLLADVEKAAGKSEGDTKSEVEKLKDAINHRYEAHEKFIEQYKQLTDLQKELYELLLKDDVDLLKLEEQVEALNVKNDAVTEAIDEFNNATVSLNDTKDETFDYLKNNKSE